jgi:hypothetical protein
MLPRFMAHRQGIRAAAARLTSTGLQQGRHGARRAFGLLRKPASRLSRGHLRAISIVFFVLAVGVFVGALVAHKGSERVTGSITHLGPVDFTLSAAPGQATSPVCGCFKIRHRKDWRGVTFATRTAEISRSIHGRGSTYSIFAANPEPADWAPGRLFFSSELLAFEHPGYAINQPRFNPATIKSGGVPKGWRLVRREPLGAQPYFFLTTDKPLFATMLGPTPIGAWIPSKEGRVHLSFQKGLTANARLRGELTEEDPSVHFKGKLSHPLADFLGPDVLIWSRDHKLSLDSANREVFSGFKQGRDVVFALYIRRPPFATRVAALPLTLNLLQSESFDVISEAHTSGPYRLSLTGPPLTARDYRRLQARLKRDDLIDLHHLTGWFPRSVEPVELTDCHEGICHSEISEEGVQTGWSEHFRYPPRPPAAEGFTVFGPLRALHLSEAKGAFSALPHRLEAPSDVHLHNVELLGSADESAMAVPATEHHYELDVSAAGNSTVNGRPIAAGSDFSLSAALLAGGTLASLFSLYFGALAWATRNSNPTSP